MEKRAEKAGIKTFCFPMHGEVDLFASWKIRRLIKKHGYDIIHSHTSHAHTLAFLGSIGTRAIRLVSRRVDYSIYRHSFLKLSGIKYLYMGDFYIAISRKIKEVMVNDGLPEDRINVVHSGIDLNRFKNSSKEHLISEFDIRKGDRVVINVAHLAWHKGQKYLVEAIPRVLASVPEARFFIVGGGELMDDLKYRAISLGIGDKLVFTGFRRDVGAFYKTADLFVMSSVQEGLGTALLDALAMGKPVVAARSGGIPEAVQDGETGLLVAAGDAKALADGIVEMLTKTGKAKIMAENGLWKVRENFSVDAMVQKNIEVYHRILSEGR